MKIVDVPQGSLEWKQARAGKVTASRISDVLAKIKTGEAASRRNYRAQLVAEIFTGAPQEDGYTNAAMQWGTDNEPFARAAYEVAQDVLVDQVGFVLHPTLDRSGCSPDGLAGPGMCQIKCPNTATHLMYLLDGAVPSEYQPQMQWEMACTGLAWSDFVSYDPRLPVDMQLFVCRLPRNDAMLAAITAEVERFLAEVDALVLRLKRRNQ